MRSKRKKKKKKLESVVPHISEQDPQDLVKDRRIWLPNQNHHRCIIHRYINASDYEMSSNLVLLFPKVPNILRQVRILSLLGRINHVLQSD